MGACIFECAVTPLFNGAPGEIRIPDHLARSQALKKVLEPINIGISVLRLSQINQSF